MGEDLIQAVAGLTGLPAVRAAILIRKALFRAGVQPEAATRADLFRALPDLEARLHAYASPLDVAERIAAIHAFLRTNEDRTSTGTRPRLADVVDRLRRANDHLSQVDLGAERVPARKPK